MVHATFIKPGRGGWGMSLSTLTKVLSTKLRAEVAFIWAALIASTADFRKRADEAQFSISPALGVAAAIVGAVVIVLVAAVFLPTFFNATADAVDAFEDPLTTTGNAEADNLLPVFAILIAITALFGIGALILGAFSLSRG